MEQVLTLAAHRALWAACEKASEHGGRAILRQQRVSSLEEFAGSDWSAVVVAAGAAAGVLPQVGEPPARLAYASVHYLSVPLPMCVQLNLSCSLLLCTCPSPKLVCAGTRLPVELCHGCTVSLPQPAGGWTASLGGAEKLEDREPGSWPEQPFSLLGSYYAAYQGA